MSNVVSNVFFLLFLSLTQGLSKCSVQALETPDGAWNEMHHILQIPFHYFNFQQSTFNTLLTCRVQLCSLLCKEWQVVESYRVGCMTPCNAMELDVLSSILVLCFGWQLKFMLEVKWKDRMGKKCSTIEMKRQFQEKCISLDLGGADVFYCKSCIVNFEIWGLIAFWNASQRSKISLW